MNEDHTRILEHSQRLEDMGARPSGFTDTMRRMLTNGQYGMFYNQLIHKLSDNPHNNEKVKFVIKRKFKGPITYDVFKLISMINNMPAGKRKYVLLHKRAHDMLEELKFFADPKVYDERIYKLMKLKDELKQKINS